MPDAIFCRHCGQKREVFQAGHPRNARSALTITDDHLDVHGAIDSRLKQALAWVWASHGLLMAS